MTRWGAALLCFLAAIAGCLYFPLGKTVLAAGIVCYAVISIRFPFFPLLFIPAFLPLVNLAPWSGIVLFEEFDLFLLATLGVSVWKGHFSKNTFTALDKTAWICIVLFFISVMISFSAGILPFHQVRPNDLSNYLSPYNSLRMGRSFFWAMALLPFFINCFLQDKNKAGRYITAGFMAGVIGVCMIVFWERGVISDVLYATNRYDLFRSLLDFSSRYRITALFSEMNTGGTAIDGYIALAWVFPLGAYFIWLASLKNSAWQVSHVVKGLLAVAAVMSGLYIIATTFTRITYLAFGVSLVFFLFTVFAVSHREHGNRNRSWVLHVMLIFMLAVFMAALVYAYQKGGFLSLFSGIFIIAGGSFLGIVSPRIPGIFTILGGLCILGTGFAVMAKGMISSKWVDTGVFEATVFSGFATWILFCICTGLGRFAANKDRAIGFLGVFVPLVIVASIAVPMVFGERMQTRFSTVTEDSATRIEHWQNVLRAMDKDVFTSIAGMGLGSFPRIFFQKDAHSRTLGTYSYETENGTGENENGNGFLRLNGGKDMELGQRFQIPGNESGKYQLIFSARSAQKDANISFRICHRNLLRAAGCKYYRIRLDNEFIGQWKPYTVDIEKNIIKQTPWYAGWPRVLLVRNHKSNTTVDIDGVALVNEYGQNLIENSSFEKGGQRWFSYNEFEHLPWHTKNMLLHFFFEQGLLGVIGFLALTAAAAWRNLQGIRKGEIFPIILLSAILGFQVVGLTDSPIDAPRVAFLYYMILMMSFTQALEART